MARDPIPTWFFVVVVVRRGHRFLLVHERKHGQLWYLPAGRVERGETIEQAARRETLEEAGIPIEVEGLVRVEFSPLAEGGARCRFVLSARPTDDTPPKRQADDESLEADWFTLDELARLPLRGAEVAELLRYVLNGGYIAPRHILTTEDTPYFRSPCS